MIKVDWQKVAGLLPVVVQDYSDGAVLMFGYMNEEALALSLETGLAHYFSRTKNRIWKKGETSGNEQIIKSAFLDCDNDTLLLKVEQKGGVACHTGAKSCFFNEVKFGENLAKNLQNLAQNSQNLGDENTAPKTARKISPYDILDEIYHVCLDRKFNADPAKSYVASLYKKGENSYLKKISEEACEFALACKDLTRAKSASEAERAQFGEHRAGEPEYDAIYEGADIIFHMLVALGDHGIHPETILRELARREGISGIEEKNSRQEK
ncbi:bifunctional phosphoribosyl-AMP cyclohydrolase/phosphoribosyl-ATP diphosphatase HisIE [Campylobacter sp. JMF_02 ED1]|uniref:bifunctional phosphoribosyl-AMP cyclohydrolase/phosphoribosyl-ATP diphosphatase HisIE n=1 Tax=unclassified Campylobacter TaxID=2593542 RepID=UPI0022EA0B1F|nr:MULTISPECIES: bifunctional phosphoribosyl-AMP cyclohydrolase/phosphoribosyl-ATP diphosphatase HisIE [unclassified Campylobacter]MDA3049821.1 bifunctional phosphoribosyl-AMP cyclohydrolase/phosphoribosyl-ATP diphosphatase HisIE [Campylobacter sp. JMF_15 NE4]MDA3050779.1 bifunctional phosphoribosyl-AMP cyclohydrolase/phosphoribosyl-ATP diphosphatase HisIE [Campylobacter sp. JMF_02 ED1]